MATQLLLESSTEYINSDIETVELAKKYIEEGVVGATSYTDCLHIALATIHNANILVSWKCNQLTNNRRFGILKEDKTGSLSVFPDLPLSGEPPCFQLYNLCEVMHHFFVTEQS